MRGDDVMALIVERITADIRLVFPDAVVRFVDDQVEVRTAEWWGAVGTNLDGTTLLLPVGVSAHGFCGRLE